MALKDQADLASDVTFQARVGAAIRTAAVAIKGEAVTSTTIPLYQARAKLAQAVLTDQAAWASKFAGTVATDAAVAGAASSPPVQGNVTDLQITNAVSAQWNAHATTV